MWSPCCHSVTMNGPDPTGACRYLLVWGSPFDQRWAGRMPIGETSGIMSTFGPSNRSTAVYLSGVSTFFKFDTKLPSVEPNFGSTSISYVNLTSSDVSSVPSVNLMPGISLNVNVSPFSFTVQELATPGTGCPDGPTSTNPLYTMRLVSGQFVDSSTGLKP